MSYEPKRGWFEWGVTDSKILFATPYDGYSIIHTAMVPTVRSSKGEKHIVARFEGNELDESYLERSLRLNSCVHMFDKCIAAAESTLKLTQTFGVLKGFCSVDERRSFVFALEFDASNIQPFGISVEDPGCLSRERFHYTGFETSLSVHYAASDMSDEHIWRTLRLIMPTKRQAIMAARALKKVAAAAARKITETDNEGNS